jgi:hypothetical protein
MFSYIGPPTAYSTAVLYRYALEPNCAAATVLRTGIYHGVNLVLGPLWLGLGAQ